MPHVFDRISRLAARPRAIIRFLARAVIFSSLLAAFALQARAEPVTIAVLGDSLVQGYGLPPEKGFVPTMQAWLDAQGLDARLINAGVSGDTTAGGLSRLAWTLTPEVDALVVSLGGNDALRGIAPQETRANLDAILATATGRGLPVLLVGIVAPGNFGDDYKQAFEAAYPALAEKYGTLFHANFLDALMRLPDRAEVLATYYQADGLHPNPAGVKLVVKDMGPLFAELVRIAAAR